MKIKNLVIGLLGAAALAACSKNPSEADKAPSPAASPTPTVTLKASGTVTEPREEVPVSPVNSSPTPPK